MGKYGVDKTPREVMIEIAGKVRAVRKENKFTQMKLSTRSGVPYATLKKFELTGQISFESLLKIFQALNRIDEFESLLMVKDLSDREKLFED